MDIVVKPFQEADRAVLRDLYLRVRSATFTWLDPAATMAQSSFDKDTDGEVIFVAWVEGRIAGFAAVWLPDLFLHHLYVDLPFQSKGVGKALFTTIRQELAGRLSLKCLSRNTAAVRFYEAHGWTTIYTGSSDEGAYLLMVHVI